MKIKIIAEIGLNHFGKIKIIKDYLARVRNKDIDGVSIQILNKKKTLKKFKCRIGKKPFFYFVDKNEAIDLDNKEDFKYLEYYVSKNLLG